MSAFLERADSSCLPDDSVAVSAVLAGTLRSGHVVDHWRTLKDLLVESRTVILDVADLRIQHASSVRFFSTALLAAGGWPPARLILVASPPRVGAAFRAPGVSRDVLMADDVTSALERVTCRPQRVSRRRGIRSGSSALPNARALVDKACREWDAGHLARAAQVVVEQMVSDTVGRSGSYGVLKLLLDGSHLRLALRDHSTSKGVGSSLRCDRLAQLCRTYGVTPLSDGRIVWAVLTN